MNFNFDEVAEIGGGRKRLQGNQIHEVTFEGCEARDIQGVKNPSEVFKVLDIKFSNDEGTFVDTIWPIKESDMEDQDNSFGGKNPSNYKQLLYKFIHLIDAVNPELGKQLHLPKDNPNRKSLGVQAKDVNEAWLKIRDLIIKVTESGKGTKTKIKLLDRIKKDKDGNDIHEAHFPGFFLSYRKDGGLFMKTNFIGNDVHWTTNELARIKSSEEAKPTKVDNTATTDEWNFGI